MTEIKFGIRIATYNRPNGTYPLLYRCLKGILKQDYINWKLFLIGDNYIPHSEFMQLAHMIPQEQLYWENLSFSPERNEYSGNDLWKVAGCTACKIGLRKITQEGLIHCPLDDDDIWQSSKHLSLLAEYYQKFPEAVFIYTQSTHKGGILPVDNMEVCYNNLPPRAYNLIHSATSWDTRRLPIMYENIIEKGYNYAAGDAWMWDTIRDYCYEKGLKTLYIPKQTVRHDHEKNDDQPREIPLL